MRLSIAPLLLADIWAVPVLTQADPLLQQQGIDAFWQVNLPTGRLGPINLQPCDSAIPGILTLNTIGSGRGLLVSPASRPPLGRST